MDRISFSARGILALPVPTDRDWVLYADPEEAHHYVRVTKQGARSFVTDRNSSKRPRLRLTHGPAGMLALTAAQSRERHRIALGLYQQGYTRDQIESQLARSEGAIPSNAMTFNEVLEQGMQKPKKSPAKRMRGERGSYRVSDDEPTLRTAVCDLAQHRLSGGDKEKPRRIGGAKDLFQGRH